MQIKLSADFQVTLGLIKKWRHQGSGKGGGGYPKLVTKSDIGGVRYMQIVRSPPNKYV